MLGLQAWVTMSSLHPVFPLQTSGDVLAPSVSPELQVSRGSHLQCVLSTSAELVGWEGAAAGRCGAEKQDREEEGEENPWSLTEEPLH